MPKNQHNNEIMSSYKSKWYDNEKKQIPNICQTINALKWFLDLSINLFIITLLTILTK